MVVEYIVAGEVMPSEVIAWFSADDDGIVADTASIDALCVVCVWVWSEVDNDVLGTSAASSGPSSQWVSR